MNNWESNGGGDVSMLMIHWLDQDNEKPIPVQIRIIPIAGLEERALSARSSRPRCGQEARQTFEPAPRQGLLANVWPPT